MCKKLFGKKEAPVIVSGTVTAKEHNDFVMPAEAPEPRRLYIPEDKIEEVLACLDDFAGMGRGTEPHLAQSARLWRLLGSIFPEVETGEVWGIAMCNGRLCIEKQKQ